MNLDFEDGIDLMVEATNGDQEDKSFQIWLTLYPNMDSTTFIPFGKFHDMSTGTSSSEVVAVKTEKSTKQLLAELNDVRKQSYQ